MKKRKENMTPDYRKSGYIKVGRSVLRALFVGENELKGLAKVLLCVDTFAYFSEGQVCLNDQVYFCHPGEWITSYTEIEELTGIDRRLVKKYLVKLEQQHFLIMSETGSYRRIALVNYEQSTQVQHGETATGIPDSGNPSGGTESSIWDMAMNLYNPNNGQKGVAN